MTHDQRQNVSIGARLRASWAMLAGRPRDALTALQVGYRGGELTEWNRRWDPSNRSADLAIQQRWSRLTSRTRDLVRNDPYAAALVNVLCTSIVGPGIGTRAAVQRLDRDGKRLLHDEFNRSSDEAFLRWSDEEADAQGRLSFGEMQQVALREVVEAGEALLLRCADRNPNRQVPLCYQLVETEQIDETADRPAGQGQTEIRRGIELDRQGRVIAYHLRDTHPNDLHARLRERTRRVPASRVIHLFLQLRANQTRGVTWFAPIVMTLKDLDTYTWSELQSATAASKYAVALFRKDNQSRGMGLSGDSDETSDRNSNEMEDLLGMPILADLGLDDRVEMIDAKRPNAEATPWIKLILNTLAAGGGISYLRLTRDYEGTNYSSGRMGHIDDQAFFNRHSRWMSRALCRPVHNDFTAQAIATGQLVDSSGRPLVRPAQFRRDPARWLRKRHTFPGQQQIDPVKETEAAVERIRAGVSTLERECALLGGNREEIMEQLQLEKEDAEARGLELSVFQGGISTPQRRESESEAEPDNA